MSHELLLRPEIICFGMAASALCVFTLHLALGWRRGAKALALLITVAASAAWAATNFGYFVTGSARWWTAQGLFDAARIGGWHVLLALLLFTRRNAILWGASVFLFTLLAWLQLPGAYTELASSAARVPFAVLLGVSVVGLVLTEQVFRRSREGARWAVKPLCLGLGGAFVLDLYLYADALLLGRVDIDAWSVRGLMQALLIPLIAITTARNKDWTIDIALSRGVVFHSTAFLASGIYLLAVAAVGYYVRYFGDSWGRTIQLGLLLVAAVLLGSIFSSGRLRSKLKVFINKNFYSYRYDYREEWLKFTNLLSAADRDTSASQRCIQALANLVESPGGALWLGDSRTNTFRQASRWNFAEVAEVLPADHAFARFLEQTGWVVQLDEMRMPSSCSPALPGWLLQLPSAWLVVPIRIQRDLFGFVILCTPRTAIELNWEVRDLLKTAAQQVGSFLGQLRSSEELLEARKFESFHKMSAFVVHDLKNVAAQLSLLMSNAERHGQKPRFQQDMLATVAHVTERMNRLLVQLSAGSHGDDVLAPVDLGELCARVVRQKRSHGRNIELQTGSGATARAHEKRLERVIGHLMQNALDATAEGGAVRVRVFSDGANGVLEVADTGCGMTAEFIRAKLFRPFETTKAAGMGIGAYEVAQYAREIGGRVDVSSEPGVGTTMQLVLPLCHLRTLQEKEVRATMSEAA